VRARLLAYWDRIRTSYWFLPSLMALGALTLAWSTLRLDEISSEALDPFGLFAATPSGARSILSGVAGAMITIAGLTFSITIVAITVASQHYGARMLRSFMRDVANQFVLGTFIAIFLYCLLVLGAIRSEEPHTFVPDLSVTMSVLFAVVGLGVLIFFIHHVSRSIDAAQLVDVVGREIDANVDTLFPEQLGEDESERPIDAPQGAGVGVASTVSGYIQVIDDDNLIGAARDHDVVVRLERRPGDLIVAGARFATVWGQRPDAALLRKLNAALVVGSERNSLQDLQFSIDQLVEIALRALSPGINAPFTAVLCIDRLTLALCRLAGRRLPGGERFDQDGTLRVIARPWSFAGALASAYDQIREHAASSTAVSARLLESLTTLAAHVRRRADAAAVLRQATLVERSYSLTTHDGADREVIREHAARVAQVLADRL
jgi:uncharacterized membrane protein